MRPHAGLHPGVHEFERPKSAFCSKHYKKRHYEQNYPDDVVNQYDLLCRYETLFLLFECLVVQYRRLLGRGWFGWCSLDKISCF